VNAEHLATPPTISVVVVAYNSADVLGRLLDSVGAAAERTSTEVIVVENASSQRDQTASIAEAHGARFVALDQNVGYGGGVNAGAAAAHPAARYLLVCNADLMFSPGAIDRLVAYADAHDDAGAVGPAILNADGTIYPSARRSPSLRHGIGHAVLGVIAPENRWSTQYRRTGSATGTRETDWLSGACLLVRRAVFDRIGGFDASYFMYFEDVDLGDRIAASGCRNIYLPEATVTHIGGHSTASSSERMLREHHRSAYRYLSRKYRGAALWPVRVVIRVGLAIRLRWTIRSVRRRTAPPPPRG